MQGSTTTHRYLSGGRHLQPDLGCAAALPFDADGHAPSGSKTRHLTIWPRRRKSRQDVERTRVALEQHLTDGGRSPEVGIYLENARVVRTEEVVRERAREKGLQALPGQMAFQQPRP